MPTDYPTTATTTLEPRHKVFTRAEANGSLVYVGRVVSDVVRQYEQLLHWRSERNTLERQGDLGSGYDGLNEKIEGAVFDLNKLFAELAAVGCELKDWSRGLVDFPSTYRQRRVWLCWELGETEVTHWHEWEAGYAGRRPVPTDFK